MKSLPSGDPCDFPTCTMNRPYSTEGGGGGGGGSKVHGNMHACI